MANTNTAGFGLRQTMTVGSTPATGGQSEFSVQSLSTLPNDMYKGDPVGYQTTAGGQPGSPPSRSPPRAYRSAGLASG